ncbi:hypothetical protein AXE80_00785 [Wenyingzhuangia fucanilytica]|uniref:Porin n=1 Tax=Wenyingzhuangia fucanilytica TaxID=1790137 RepID=A0A1B1Y2B6_9FLAO|nr:porin [Wenyingzhuangia fucanilytica]ANW94915.1 hypothetical protein AXE80_00785 [Wenyingzhuangia fucanilytica]
MKLNTPVLSFILFFLTNSLFAQDDNDFSLDHDQNIKLISNEKSLNIGGRIMFDNAVFSESNLLNASYAEKQIKSGEQFRRLFFYATGALYSNLEYKLQLNFINGQVGIRDAFIGLKNVPIVGRIRIGQVKEPIRLDVLNSSNYLTFLERSFNTDFMPIRNSGILLMDDYYEHRLSYQLGAFRNSDKNTGNDKIADDSFVVTGRFTGMPIYEQTEFLHLGIAGSYRKYDDHEFNVDAKPEVNLSNISYVAITGLTDVNHVNIVNSEIAYSNKAFNFQGEYMYVDVRRYNSVNHFSTYYGQVSWYLTGEHKQIKNPYSMFNRFRPKHNLSANKSGAWELAFRYSHVDMNHRDVAGGIQDDYTLGLNWYLNPYTRFMFNQIYADVYDKGNANISQLRVQIDF